jgi:hypothetical protein
MVTTSNDFYNSHWKLEGRRLFSELLGTFFLVLVAAGAGMMGQAFPDTITRTAAVVAPGLMVIGIILFMGKVSGAHLNPAVSVVRPSRRFPVAPRARLHRHPARRSDPRRLVPPVHHPRLRDLWLQLCGRRILRDRRIPDGSSSHPGSVERHPGYRIARPERRCAQRAGGRRVHHPGRLVGQSDLGCVHEPGPHVRPRPRRSRLHRLLGIRRGAIGRGDRRGRRGVGAPRSRWGRSGSEAAQGTMDTEIERPDQP